MRKEDKVTLIARRGRWGGRGGAAKPQLKRIEDRRWRMEKAASGSRFEHRTANIERPTSNEGRGRKASRRDAKPQPKRMEKAGSGTTVMGNKGNKGEKGNKGNKREKGEKGEL